MSNRKYVYRNFSFIIIVVSVICTFSYYYFKTPTAVTIFSFLNDRKVKPEKGLQFEFIFTNEFDGNLYRGLAFNTSWNIILDELNLLNVKTNNDNTILTSTPVIGTAISSNHVDAYKNFLRNVGRIYMGIKVVYLYDLGLRSSERIQLMQEFGHVIKEIRNFTFEKYPPYFRNLRGFRWKPLVVADMLKEFQSMWWMDASVRIFKPLDHFYNVYSNCTTNTCKYYPWVLITAADHSIFSATDKKMYDYLPMPITVTKKLQMWGATLQLIFATKEVRENVLRYWVLCALEEGCMDPPGSSIDCKFATDRFRIYAGCNRQDQSAINIILSGRHAFTDSKYCRTEEDVLRILPDCNGSLCHFG